MRERRAARTLRGQLLRFALAGGLTVSLDYLIYQGIRELTGWTHPAKAASFAIATIVAYLLNRRWTFGAEGGASRMAGFAALYGCTFTANVSMNALALWFIPSWRGEVAAAFLMAQAISTTINFLVMRTVIFRAAAAPNRSREGQVMVLT